jgi:hypothetical protein
MALEVTYDILAAGPSLDACREKVTRFFGKTILVKFDTVNLDDRECLAATDERFNGRLAKLLKANQTVLANLIEELKEAGYHRLDDFHDVAQGYTSKLFHTMAHHLDGFIGVDAPFYNLEEDSHGISETLARRITSEPSHFWLIRVKAGSGSGAVSQLGRLRDPEKEGNRSA